MTEETFKITKVPTLNELKELNWIQFVYPSSHMFRGYPRDGDIVFEKQCLRYKVLKNGTCKCMNLFYWNFAGFDHKMLLDTNSSDRNWDNCSIDDLYHQINTYKTDKGAYMEANGNPKEFSSRLSGKRVSKPSKKVVRK